MKQYTFLETLQIFLSPMKENKKLLSFSLTFFLSDAITNIWLLYLFKIIVDDIALGINIYFYVFIFFVGIKFLIIIYFRNFFGTFYPEMRKYFYNKYLHEYLQLDNNKSELHGTGKVISVVEKSTMVWLEQLANFFKDFIGWILNITLSLLIVFSINYYYGCIILFLIIMIFIITIIIQKVNRKYRLERRELNIDISKKIVNLIISKFEILQNFKWKSEVNKIVSILEKNKQANSKMSNNDVYLGLFSNFIIYATRIWVIVLFVYGFDRGLLSMWEFIIFVSFTYILEKSLTGLTSMYTNFSNNLVDIEKVWEFFDWESKIIWYEEWNEFKYENGNIEIKNLNFYYYEGKNIFSNFNLPIAGWKVTAFVGNSGSGKSTLVKLISWYIRANSWDIIVDWQKISETSLKSYYKNIWYLTQEPSVFDGTILENLTYAISRELKPWELDRVISQSKCEFIYELPQKEFSHIWERWVKLSGWQKQRLAIAKIMLKDPHIIILDEPTSALDSFSEEQITNAMNNLFKDKTVIIVAHRLQTVKHADNIIVLDNGQVVEEWNHKTLIHKNWIYKKMLDLQSGF